MKKILMIFMIISLVLVTGCKNETKKTKDNNDAVKFKEEYESLNGKTNASGLEHRTVTIDSNNPYVYTTAEDIVKKIENKETFYLYVGDKQCPWCRSVVEKSIEIANKYGVKKIYYINIWDDDHNEILRDVYKLNDDNKPEKVSDGTSAYYKLLDYFKDLLRDYTLTDGNGNLIEVGEKRIFAPNFIYVKNGKAISLTTGKSKSQKDSREKLTEEMLKDEENEFKNFFSQSSTCDESC